MQCPSCDQELSLERQNLDWHLEPVGKDMAEVQVVCHVCGKVAAQYQSRPMTAAPDPDPELEAAPGAEEAAAAPAAETEPAAEATPGAEEPGAAPAAETALGIPGSAEAEED